MTIGDNSVKSGAETSKQHPDIAKKAAKGSFWVISIRVLTQAISFVRYIILANILGVANMGLLGVALLVIAILNAFSNTGFQSALIQKKDDIHNSLDTAWTAGLVRAVLLYAVLFLAAPFAAMLKVPDEDISLTISVIRTVGIVLILDAISNIGMIYFRKELQFHKQFIYEISSTIINALTTIIIAVIYRSIWSVVAGLLVSRIVKTFLSYNLHSYRPSISICKEKFCQLWRFGKWVFFSTICNFLLNQGDDIFVWGFFGASPLGLYQIAYKLSNLPTTEISNVVSQVSFPVYSKLQAEKKRLAQAYLKILTLTAFVSAPFTALIFSASPAFVRLFLKSEWSGAADIMQILVIFSFIQSVGSTRGPVFLAIGKTRIPANIAVIKLIIISLLIYPLTKHYGLEGTALTILLVSFAGYIAGLVFLVRHIPCTFFECVKPVLYPLSGGVIMVLSFQLAEKFVFGHLTFVSLALNVILTCAVYVLWSIFIHRFLGYNIKSIIAELKALLLK